MQVGKTKDQGLYNKPSAAAHPASLAVGTLPQYNTIQYKWAKTDVFHIIFPVSFNIGIYRSSLIYI